MLSYSKGPAPKALTGWQATPNADWESVPADDKDEVRDALLRDQGKLCVYCQRRIPTKDGRMKVEHWQAQSKGNDDTLQWSNLLGVCLGSARLEGDSTSNEQHCDSARGEAPLFLHPVAGRGPNPVEYLRYTNEGEARASATTSTGKRVQQDIIVLNLNTERLRRGRREVLEELKSRLDKAGWSTGALRAEYRAAALHPGTKVPEYCEVVRYYLRRWARHRNVDL